ncbi:MAG: hypothetical protein IIY21_11585 [Clostridiales bacterium]|nr:hypothetical protein [Clostridiales bacterium]MBQ1574097.1 hypothetical protein [Clostridiales bacterium]
MAEYIEKQHLMDFLDGCIEEEKGNRSQVIVEAIKMTIDRMPLADLVERKRGEWDKDSNMAFYWKCSECGAYLFWRHEEFMVNGNLNYCPNCGADMRKQK